MIREEPSLSDWPSLSFINRSGCEGRGAAHTFQELLRVPRSAVPLQSQSDACHEFCQGLPEDIHKWYAERDYDPRTRGQPGREPGQGGGEGLH